MSGGLVSFSLAMLASILFVTKGRISADVLLAMALGILIRGGLRTGPGIAPGLAMGILFAILIWFPLRLIVEKYLPGITTWRWPPSRRGRRD